MADNNEICEKAAKDYAKYFDRDIGEKLKPVTKIINNILGRLEEFETMINFAKQDVEESTDALASLAEFSVEFKDLCSKIDTVQKVVDHIRGNLSNLEGEIEKAEQKFGINNENKLVSNILTPLLFRKTQDKNNVTNNLPLFETKDYFTSEGDGYVES